MTDKITWTKLASEHAIEKTVEALQANNITPIVVETAEDAKAKVLSLIPEGSEVMTATSETLRETGIVTELDDSGKYNSVKKELTSLDREKDGLKMQKLGAAPEYVVGSVHAVTEDGKVFIASMGGSQLPSYAYGAMHVIWVVGTQKIVKDEADAKKRIYDHVLELESERAREAYGIPGSSVNKMLIINKEANPERITLIFVKEKLGF
jgi:LUD domain